MRTLGVVPLIYYCQLRSQPDTLIHSDISGWRFNTVLSLTTAVNIMPWVYSCRHFCRGITRIPKTASLLTFRHDEYEVHPFGPEVGDPYFIIITKSDTDGNESRLLTLGGPNHYKRQIFQRREESLSVFHKLQLVKDENLTSSDWMMIQAFYRFWPGRRYGPKQLRSRLSSHVFIPLYNAGLSPSSAVFRSAILVLMSNREIVAKAAHI